MIQPTVDFGGKLSRQNLEGLDLDAIEEEARRYSERFSVLDSLKLVQYDDVVDAPGATFDIVLWPHTFAIIPHNLGYVPQFLVYYKYAPPTITDVSYQKLPMIRSGADGGSLPADQRKIGFFLKTYADTANIYIVGGGGFTLGAAQPEGGFKFRYYIFAQPNN